MVPEASVEEAAHGLIARGPGWYVLNARDSEWRQAEGRGAICDLEGDTPFPQIGFSPFVLGPGDAMSMYHWEVDQEDFLIVAGEALLIIEGEERALEQWDFVHCPPGTKHTILGAGSGPCVVIAVGARGSRSSGPEWGGYSVDDAAIRHNAGVQEETADQYVAYAPVPGREPTRYRDGWLPE